MKRLYYIALPILWAVLTVLALPALGWTAETGNAVLEAGADAGAGRVAEAQLWIDFLKANLETIFSILGIAVTGVIGLALLIRAQVKLWRADAAGVRVTSAVTDSGCEPAVKAVMDAAPKGIKAIVKRWASIK